MGIEQPIMSGAGKGISSSANFLFLPTGKLNLIVTAIVFLILAFVGTAESFEQHSFYPVFSRALLPLVGADTSINIMMDDLSVSPPPTYSGWFSKSFPAYFWFWLKWWFLVLCNIWMIFFFCWLVYNCYRMLDSNLILRNIILTIITFIIISLFIGMIMYNVRLSGMCLPPDRLKNFNHMIGNTYPLVGISKLAMRFINYDTFKNIAVWSDSSFGRMISNIAPSPNILNDTNVSSS